MKRNCEHQVIQSSREQTHKHTHIHTQTQSRTRPRDKKQLSRIFCSRKHCKNPVQQTTHCVHTFVQYVAQQPVNVDRPMRRPLSFDVQGFAPKPATSFRALNFPSVFLSFFLPALWLSAHPSSAMEGGEEESFFSSLTS